MGGLPFNANIETMPTIQNHNDIKNAKINKQHHSNAIPTDFSMNMKGL